MSGNGQSFQREDKIKACFALFGPDWTHTLVLGSNKEARLHSRSFCSAFNKSS